MAGELTVISYAGVTAINDGASYRASLLDDSENGGTYQGDVVTSERPDAPPVYVRTQPNGIVLELLIEILGTNSQAKIDALKGYFDPAQGEQYLVVQDEDMVQRRMLFASRGLVRRTRGTVQWIAILEGSAGVWEAVTLDSATVQVTSSGQTFAISNGGNARAPVKITITPQAVKGNTNHYIRYRHLVLANRSERPYTDPIGVGWPVDVFNNAFDAAAEVTATQMQADGGDLRILNNGVELHRWLDPATMNANQRSWVNLQFRPMKRVTLAAAMSSGSVPAAGSTFEVSNAQGTRELPTDSFILVGTECIHVEVVDGTTLEVKERGALGTTAAGHSASDHGYWVEHPYLIAVYDYTAAANPSPPDDEKPLIDLANSRNNKLVYSSTFIVPAGTRRSGGWQPEFTDEGPTSGNIRVYESSGTLVFEDELPEAGKPNYNNVVLSPPAGIKAAAAAAELDFTIENNMRLRGYLLDREGYESQLLNEEPQSAQTDQQYQPGQVADSLRLSGRIGSVVGSVAGSDTASAIDDTIGHQGYRVVVDEETLVTHIVLKLQNVSGGSSADLLWQFVPDQNGMPHPDLSPIVAGTIANADIPSTAGWVVEPASGILQAGAYWLLFFKSTSSGTINSFYGARSKGRSYTIGLLFGVPIPVLAATGQFLVLSDETQPQYDAALETAHKITLDNIELTLDDSTPRTLLCVLGAERTLYWLNARLKNDTTGKYLDFSMPMLLEESLEVDCERRLVTYGEHERRVPWAVTPSHPGEWLQLLPGTNTFSWTETGVNDTDVGWEKRDRYL